MGIAQPTQKVLKHFERSCEAGKGVLKGASCSLEKIQITLFSCHFTLEVSKIFCSSKENKRLTSICAQKRIYGLVWLTCWTQINRGMLLWKRKHINRTLYISKTFEVIPLLCSVIVRLQLEYFVQFCVLLSKIGGGLAEKHIEESTKSDLKSGNHDLWGKNK